MNERDDEFDSESFDQTSPDKKDGRKNLQVSFDNMSETYESSPDRKERLKFNDRPFSHYLKKYKVKFSRSLDYMWEE